MRRFLSPLPTLALALLMLPLGLRAQGRIGYLSYGQVMPLMPEYVAAREEVAKLRGQCDDEATRGEQEFQRKFTEFLQGQKDFPQNIMLKRQAELQTLLENAEEFRREAERLVGDREAELMGEVRARLAKAVGEVGTEGGYSCILNTDGDLCPFLNPAVADDVTSLVLRKLGLADASPSGMDTAPPSLPDASSPSSER